jgi:hypothetical protein
MKTRLIIFSVTLIAVATAVFNVVDASLSNSDSKKMVIPFAAGERLSYEGKFSKVVRGITVADLTFELNEDEVGNNQIVMEAKSKGTVLRLFRFSFLQRYQTLFDEGLKVLRTVKFDQQRERVRESEASFDYEIGRVVYTERNPKDPMKAPRTVASDFNGEVHDMLTSIYLLRTMPLTVGSNFEVSVSDSGLVYRVPVTVTKRELQNTAIGRVMCFRIEPQVFGDGRLIEEKGEMIIWITDDARRIPVRSVIKADIGQIDIRLKNFVSGNGNQTPASN